MSEIGRFSLKDEAKIKDGFTAALDQGSFLTVGSIGKAKAH